MRLSESGYRALVREEGLRLTAYPDPGSGAAPWTIGIGSTHYADGRAVKPGDTLTEDEAHVLAIWHVERVEAGIADVLLVSVSGNQWDALVSLAFNIGTGAFARSTLLKKLNAGDYAGAAREFGRWVYASGKVLPGLVARRKRERELFESDIQSEESMPLPAFIGPAFAVLAETVPTLIRHFGKGEQSEKNAAVVEKVVGVAKDAIGAVNEQDLVERLRDPDAVQIVDRAISAAWISIVEAGGGGLAGAREANDRSAEKPLLRQPAVVMALAVLPLIYMVAAAVMFGAGFSDETRVMVVSLVLGGALGGMVAFFWGSSMSSRAKDEALARRL
jgi:lysozyme